jgi:Spy/CpxP family protein refolding chaperone
MTRENSETLKGFRRKATARRSLLALFLLLTCVVCEARAQDARGAAQEQNVPQNINLNDPKELDSYLNLSDEQKEQIRAIRQQTQPNLNELQRRQQQAQRALNAAIYSGAPEAEVEARARDLAAAHDAFIRQRAARDAQIIRVLTPPQRARLTELYRQAQAARQQQQLQQRMQRRQERREQRNNLNNQAAKPNTPPAQNSKPNATKDAAPPRANQQNKPRRNRLRPNLFAP